MSYTNIKAKLDRIKDKIIHNGKLSKEQLNKINNKFRLEWNFNSNSMEGNTLTIEETRSVMVGNLDVHQKPIKDVLEMKGHDVVISDILKIGKGELRLSEKRIKDIHAGIMHEENPEKKLNIGQWKTIANEIINPKGEKYLFVAPELVPDRMHDLLNRTNAAIDAFQSNSKKAPHPIDIALQFHLEYLEIHPFYDGNGRTARILTNLILIALGYTPFWISKTERSVYYNYISDIQSYGGDKEAFFKFVSGLVERSEQMVLDVIEGKGIEEEDDVEKEIALLKRQLKGEKITKSPKGIFTVFELIDDKIWKTIQNVLKQFDELFDENKTTHTVNYLKEIFTPKPIFTIFENPLVKETAPKELKIFGHDIYENNIDTIEWKNSKYGLKNSNYNSNQEIKLVISYNLAEYNIKLSINNLDYFDKTFYYEEFPNSEMISGIKKIVAEKLLKEIKAAIKK